MSYQCQGAYLCAIDQHVEHGPVGQVYIFNVDIELFAAVGEGLEFRFAFRQQPIQHRPVKLSFDFGGDGGAIRERSVYGADQ